MPKNRTPLPRYPALTASEKAARAGELAGWYEGLGVRVSHERLRKVLNATCWIPFEIFKQALHELLVAKDDKFQTAPQPGEIFSKARAIARRLGDLTWSCAAGGWAEPDWAQATRRLEHTGRLRLGAGGCGKPPISKAEYLARGGDEDAEGPRPLREVLDVVDASGVLG